MTDAWAQTHLDPLVTPGSMAGSLKALRKAPKVFHSAADTLRIELWCLDMGKYDR